MRTLFLAYLDIKSIRFIYRIVNTFNIPPISDASVPQGRSEHVALIHLTFEFGNPCITFRNLSIITAARRDKILPRKAEHDLREVTLPEKKRRERS